MHPRFVHFPWQADYAAQPNIFAPYVMSLAEPEYKSSSLNIDKYGFRVQFDANGNKIDLSDIKNKYPSCTLLLGNSTSFGVSLSEDRKTLGHFLGSSDSPCINLSVRGATMQQELAIFHNMKILLPEIKRIIIVTGICDISLATQPEDIYSPALGGMHSTSYYYKQFFERIKERENNPDSIKHDFLHWAEAKFFSIPIIRRFFEWRRTSAIRTLPKPRVFEDNVEIMFSIIRNSIQSWGWLARGSGIKIDIVLQPVIGWSAKKPSAIEKACLEADYDRIPAISLYVNKDIYQKTRQLFAESCRHNGIGFIDANEFFENDKLSSETLFTDICHLSDAGTELLGRELKNRLRISG